MMSKNTKQEPVRINISMSKEAAKTMKGLAKLSERTVSQWVRDKISAEVKSLSSKDSKRLKSIIKMLESEGVSRSDE